MYTTSYAAASRRSGVWQADFMLSFTISDALGVVVQSPGLFFITIPGFGIEKNAGIRDPEIGITSFSSSDQTPIRPYTIFLECTF